MVATLASDGCLVRLRYGVEIISMRYGTSTGKLLSYGMSVYGLGLYGCDITEDRKLDVGGLYLDLGINSRLPRSNPCGCWCPGADDKNLNTRLVFCRNK